MRRFVCLVGVLGALALRVMGQGKIDGFESRMYTNEAGKIMPYRLFIPAQYNPQRTYPLVLWLHGAGGTGTDNLRQISGDQIPGTHLWTKAENQAVQPMFVLAPQSQSGWVLPKEPGLNPELQMAMGVLESVRKEYRIDTKRIYVAGQSLGGFATWAVITSYPRLFAAAIVLCNSGSLPKLARNIRNLPVWVFQGEKDSSLFVTASVEMVEAIRKAGGNAQYTSYPDAGHDIWERAFSEPSLVKWLFAQHK
jgi:predicted peptidase